MESAAAAYRKALIIDPDLVPAIVNLANIHYARDELIEAQALYERAIGLESDFFELDSGPVESVPEPPSPEDAESPPSLAAPALALAA